MIDERRRLGEMLRSAREERGIDRSRVERETRIRERHLAALERGAFEELPGEVYARGFLRSYSRYLGLDPDTVLARYRIATRPRGPAAAPAHGMRLVARPAPWAVAPSPRLGVVAALVLLVGGLVAYVGYQVVTFARTPELELTQPTSDVRGHASRWITFTGLTEPNARVWVAGVEENPSTTADESGRFRLRVELLPGMNVVRLTAHDPRTMRRSPEVTRRVEVVPAAATAESGVRHVPVAERAGRGVDGI